MPAVVDFSHQILVGDDLLEVWDFCVKYRHFVSLGHFAKLYPKMIGGEVRYIRVKINKPTLKN